MRFDEYAQWVGRVVECTSDDDMREVVEGNKYTVLQFRVEQLNGTNLPPVAQFLIADEEGKNEWYCCFRFELVESSAQDALISDAAEAAELFDEDELEDYIRRDAITHDDMEAALFARRPRG